MTADVAATIVSASKIQVDGELQSGAQALNNSQVITALGASSQQFYDNDVSSYSGGSGLNLPRDAHATMIDGSCVESNTDTTAALMTIVERSPFFVAGQAITNSVNATASSIQTFSDSSDAMLPNNATNSAGGNVGVFAIQGMSMTSYTVQGYSTSNYPSMLTEAKTDGANWVELSSVSQINMSSGAITSLNLGDVFPGNTISLSSLGSAIAAAEAQGLNVLLKPQIMTLDADGNYNNLLQDSPSDSLVIANPAAFFASYEAYILQFAELAQQYNVSMLSIGNEMAYATLPQYTPYWDNIIAAVRGVYSGALTYSAEIGTPFFYNSSDPSAAVNDEVQHIQFWNLLDYVGMDVYPGLTQQSVLIRLRHTALHLVVIAAAQLHRSRWLRLSHLRRLVQPASYNVARQSERCWRNADAR
jgi:hypothetical protein